MLRNDVTNTLKGVQAAKLCMFVGSLARPHIIGWWVVDRLFVLAIFFHC
jgi:hypothetical protein